MTTTVLAALTELESTEVLTVIGRWLKDVAAEAPSATLPEILAAVERAIADRRPADRPLVDVDFDEGWADVNRELYSDLTNNPTA